VQPAGSDVYVVIMYNLDIILVEGVLGLYD